MCWRGKNIPMITEKDINVFKIVSGGERSWVHFRSAYYAYEYSVGKTYTHGEIKPYLVPRCLTEDKIIINEGFHCYSLKKCKIDFLGVSVAGILSETTNKYIDSYNIYIEGSHVLHCHIPKGTRYYENEKGEIVTEKLTVDSAEPITNFIGI